MRSANWILFSVLLTTRRLISLNHAACPVWDKNAVKVAAFYILSQPRSFW